MNTTATRQPHPYTCRPRGTRRPSSETVMDLVAPSPANPPAFAGWTRRPRGRWELVAEAVTAGEVRDRLGDLVARSMVQLDVVVLPVGQRPPNARGHE